MISELHQYLVQHKSVSIPGLGTIYVERTPAQSDFVNHQILPPSYHYRFDKYFDAPDKEFFTFLAARKSIADYEAIKLYNEWAFELRNRIRKENEVEWESIGKLIQDPSGEIIFEPTAPLVAGLTPVPAERIIRNNAEHTMLVGDRQRTSFEMNEYLHEETESRKRPWWVYAIIVAAVALVVLFVHYYGSNNGIEATGNQQRILRK